LDISAGLVISQDDGICPVIQTNLEKFFRINNGPGETALRYSNLFGHTICFVHQNDPEFFMRQITHQGIEDLKGIVTIGNLILLDNVRFVSYASQSEHGTDLNGDLLSDTFELLEI
jgi:hypothetical protein